MSADRALQLPENRLVKILKFVDFLTKIRVTNLGEFSPIWRFLKDAVGGQF
jgi:hypothetical protein